MIRRFLILALTLAAPACGVITSADDDSPCAKEKTQIKLDLEASAPGTKRGATTRKRCAPHRPTKAPSARR